MCRWFHTPLSLSAPLVSVAVAAAPSVFVASAAVAGAAGEAACGGLGSERDAGDTDEVCSGYSKKSPKNWPKSLYKETERPAGAGLRGRLGSPGQPAGTPKSANGL